ncbi:flap structure-specific endonuclease, partial [Candidatus Woesearchaeota archaeon]|nr:flap structure-specific endonuclease [Candidatus Woesearchaeota archaeon]
LKALGLPVIQAPSEGEAQAAFIVKDKDAWAVVSQDADAFLFGADKVVKNLSVAGKRKLPSKFAFTTVRPQVFDLKENLKELEISQDQLIALGVLVGTDFNPGGIKGIGPKKGLKLVKEHGDDFEKLFSSVDWPFDFSWKEPFNLIKKMKVTKKYKLEWGKIDSDKVVEILCKRHDFSEERILKKLKDGSKKQEKQKQKGLSQWC